MIQKNTALKWRISVCPFCGLGCGVEVGIADNRVVEVRGMSGHPVNNGDLCDFPLNYPPIIYHKDRLKYPMIRRNGKLIKTSWDTAITYTAYTLKRIIKKFGSDAVAFYGGAINFTEEYYIMNKLMKAAIGTNNMECSTRICMASTAMGFISTIGADAPPTCYEDIEKADLFLIAGSNLAVSSPVLFRRILASRKRRGSKMIVVDPKKTKTAYDADIHLQIKPGTDVALNNSITHILFKEGYIDENKVDHYASGLEELKQFVKKYTPSYCAKITGCPEQQIIKTAHEIGSTKAMITIWLQGYNHSSQAVFKNNSLHNLWILTENFGRPGVGPLSITGECNALGNRWVGALSHLLPGMRFTANSRHREEIADFWKIPVESIQSSPGKSILDIIEGLHSEEIRCLWITTTNPAASLPNTKWVKEALLKAEMLVVQDIFHPTETTLLGDLILPAAGWCEKSGTYISSERRIQLVEKFIDPPGEAKPDYEIICAIGKAMGFNKEFSYNSAEEIFMEYKKITKGKICDIGGVTYKRLRENFGPQLPCPSSNHPGTPRLFTDLRFPRPDGRSALLLRDYKEPAEVTSKDYPFILITGRISSHFNTRTRTGRSPKLNSKAPDCYIEINPEDAEDYCLTDNDIVEISSRRGRICLPAKITESVCKGTIFIPWHYGSALGNGNEQEVNLLTNNVYDIHSKQPEYKYSAVKISKF